MFRFLALALIVAFASAFTAPIAARASMSITMQQQPQEPAQKAPSSGWTLTMAGGERTVDDVKKAQKKAAKSYDQKDGCDDKEYKKGWPNA